MQLLRHMPERRKGAGGQGDVAVIEVESGRGHMNKAFSYTRALFSAVILFACIYSANAQVTQAWHVTNTTGTEGPDGQPAAHDREGHIYYAYLQGNTVRLAKYSPAVNLYFDVLVDTYTSPPVYASVYASHPVRHEAEFMYVVVSGPAIGPSMRLYK